LSATAPWKAIEFAYCIRHVGEGDRREDKARRTERIFADHVGGHSNVVARDQHEQQRCRSVAAIKLRITSISRF
jgi:hypothetical protein